MKRDYKHLAEELKKFIGAHSSLYGLEVKLTERKSTEEDNEHSEVTGIDLVCGYSLYHPEVIAQFVAYHSLFSYLMVHSVYEDGACRDKLVWHLA